MVRLRFAPARQSSLSALLRAKTGGAEGIRTPDPHNAIVVLYQLSYDPIWNGTQSKSPPPFVKTFRRSRPVNCD